MVLPNAAGVSKVTLGVPTTKTSEDNLSPSAKPRVAEDKPGEPPSRLSLRLSATWWRNLQCMGMGLHFMASPRPPSPDFTRTVASSISDRPGEFTLHFYVPADYKNGENGEYGGCWPAVVNFHGGGFTLGSATDDARFARFIVERTRAVFISVDYRLAPEYPFPVAVEDGTDALLYIIQNAKDLQIDPNRLATSGFSAGGNIAITAPIRLHLLGKTRPVPKYTIVATATFYPITDYTISREERRADSVRPEATLPASLTNLFDASYLFPPGLDLGDPCLSPNKASNELLINGLPNNIFFYTCEWDMLLREGEYLARRLEQPPVSKHVFYTMIPRVTHGWDKSPNPMKAPPKSERIYRDCSTRLRKVFAGNSPRSALGRPHRVPPPPLPPRG